MPCASAVGCLQVAVACITPECRPLHTRCSCTPSQDEPTSGMDASSCLTLVCILKCLSNTHLAVGATLERPRHNAFRLLDHVRIQCLIAPGSDTVRYALFQQLTQQPCIDHIRHATQYMRIGWDTYLAGRAAWRRRPHSVRGPPRSGLPVRLSSACKAG